MTIETTPFLLSQTSNEKNQPSVKKLLVGTTPSKITPSHPYDCLLISSLAKKFGKLVLLGCDITVYTPAAYQGRSLQPPLMDILSWGWLRA